MTSLIGIAETALNIKNDIAFQSSSENGSLQNKIVIHWSYHVLRGAAIVGAIVSIAAIVFNQLALVAAGLLLIGTNCLGAHYIKKFNTLKVLEDYVKKLSEKIHALHHRINELEQTNEELEALSEKFKEIPNYLKIIEREKNEIDQKTNQIAELTNQLAEMEQKMERFACISDDMKYQVAKIGEEAVRFSKENGFLGDHIDTLSKQVSKIHLNKSSIEKEVNEIDIHTKDFDQLNKEFGRQIKVFNGLFQLMKEMYLEAKSKMEKLNEEVTNLKVIVPGAVLSSEKTTQSVEELKRLATLLDKKLNRMKKWKSSKDYQSFKEFQQWKKEQRK